MLSAFYLSQILNQAPNSEYYTHDEKFPSIVESIPPMSKASKKLVTRMLVQRFEQNPQLMKIDLKNCLAEGGQKIIVVLEKGNESVLCYDREGNEIIPSKEMSLELDKLASQLSMMKETNGQIIFTLVKTKKGFAVKYVF